MNGWRLRQNIELAVKAFQDTPLQQGALNLFDTLDYRSNKTLPVPLETAARFVELSNRAGGNMNMGRALLDEWESIDLLFQLTGEEIEDIDQGSLFDTSGVDISIYECYLFFVLKLRGTHYTRTQLAQISREINKPQRMPPAMVLFQHGDKLTFAVIDRRPGKRDDSKKVLEKVTLLKDINFSDPHPAHIRILADLSFGKLYQQHEFTNFLGLHQAWKDTLNTEELNKRFYRELFDWFEWAISEARFPTNAEEQVIRLITRLLFVWFIKEKGLVADELFREKKVSPLLKDYDRDTGDSYYRAVLQNLFFGTLNAEIENRGFGTGTYANDQTFSQYCYQDEIADPDTLLKWFSQTPFINGGLFDCLDREGGCIDCFGDNRYEQLSIPNRLFFQKGTDGSQGLIPLLESYKFTVEENTTIEEDVALDPELLGRVFEHLLAAYNPETKESVRKQTGSYYTRRPIVNYMTDESLVAYLKDALPADNQQQGSSLGTTTPPIQQSLLGPPEPVQTEISVIENESLGEAQQSTSEKKIRHLLAYDDEPPQFTEWETERLMDAIDSLKVLDPAVGSGAFLMAMLHKLTHILRRLDSDNRQWEQLQKTRATQKLQTALEISNRQERNDELTKISDTFDQYRDSDFGRKLYLIQNSIFGVDIQPFACQIAKLRFFITLTIEQTPDPTKDNMGIKPLPNLETRFIGADTLIGLQASEVQLLLEQETIQQLQQELVTIREAHYLPSNQSQKQCLEAQDETVLKRLEEELEKQRTEWVEVQERAINQRAEALRNNADREQWREMEQRTFEERLQKFDSEFENVHKIISWKPYDQNATADFFNPEWMFGITEGFDVVIGNPPYIQLQKNEGRLGRLYAPCNFDSFTKTGDIYCLFYERANQLLKKGGYVCFITSNKWMRTKYGIKLRNYFIENTLPVQLLDMGPNMFDAPTVDTNTLLLRNTLADVTTTFTAATLDPGFDVFTGDIAKYLNDKGKEMELPPSDEPWVILSPAELALKRKIESVGKPLKDWDINIHFGIKTGCNDAFIIDEAKREELITQDPRSAEIIKPLLRGRGVECYYVQQTESYILATGYDLDIPNRYPAIYNHLEIIGEQIESGEIEVRGKGLFLRDDQGENWWNLRACAYYSEFEKEKIVWKRIGSILRFAYSQDSMFCLDSTCIATGEKVRFLAAVLNSPLSHYQLFRTAPKTGTGDLIVSVQALEPLLVPPITEANQHLVTQIEDKVDQILDAIDTDQDFNVSELEDEIDQLVYSLYSLTPNEIEIVKGNS